MRFIRLGISPWGVVMLLMKKSIWIYTNYKQLNIVMIKNNYLIPHINGLVDQLQDASVFLKINFRYWYHNLNIRD